MSKHKSDGGKTDFYNIPNWVKDVDDLAEFLNLDGFLFNILKSMFGINKNRHEGTNSERDSRKLIHYSIRNYLKIMRNNYRDYDVTNVYAELYTKLSDEEKEKFNKITGLKNDV